MRTFRRAALLLALATLLAVPASLPVLAQSGAPSSITHRQSVRTEMSAAGEVTASRVFTQLTVQGDGDVEVVLPGQSTRGLRNLDGFGRPRTDGDQVTFTVTANRDGVAERTVADNTSDLPIELEVAYTLDGRPIEPKALVGKSGNVEVTFTARNVTARPTEVTYLDGELVGHTETLDVAVPFVGSISLELDSRFVGIEAPGASVAGNGRGDTFVSWSLVMFEPIGSEEQTIGYSAYVSDAIVPGVVAQFLPVDSDSFGSIASVQDTFGSVADGLRELTAGGVLIDDNVKLLAGGAGQLLDGIDQLSTGAEQLATGMNETAVPGAEQLADGTGTARTGSGSLAAGMVDLADGTNRLSDGITAASAGSGRISTGIDGLARGIGQPQHDADDGTVIGGINSLRAGIAALPASAQEGLSVGLTDALQGLVRPQLVGGVERGLTAGLQGQVRPGLVAGIEDGIEANLGRTLQLQVRPQIVSGLQTEAKAGLQAGLTDELFVLMQGNADPDPAKSSGLAGLLLWGNPAAGLPGLTGGDPAIANLIAAAYFQGVIAQGAPELFATTASERLAAGLDAKLEPSFDALATGFAAGFARGVGVDGDGVDGAVEDAFDTFIAAFVRGEGIPGGGFDASLGDAFDRFAVEFAAGYREGLDASLQEQALPGFDRLLGGLDNPRCDTDDPTNPRNPCGVRQVLELLGPGAQDLSAGLDELDAGGRRLVTGTATARDGASALADGLVRIDDGASRLAAGLDDAGEGATKLSDGLIAAEDGAESLAEGAQRLTDEGTSALVAGASGATSTPAIAVEHAKAADARGKAGDGLPYGTVDGALASAVYQFELAGIGSKDGGPSMPYKALNTLLAFAAVGTLGFGLRRRLL
jgi:putative membrane protein